MFNSEKKVIIDNKNELSFKCFSYRFLISRNDRFQKQHLINRIRREFCRVFQWKRNKSQNYKE